MWKEEVKVQFQVQTLPDLSSSCVPEDLAQIHICASGI